MSTNILSSMTIALGANVTGFQSGLKGAQKSLVQFQQSADKIKGVNFDSLRVSTQGMITPLGKLQGQLRGLGAALKKAYDEDTVKALNAQLEKTQAEISRIKALGRQDLVPGVKPTVKGMNDLVGSAGQVNTEFARIIQDAPFGSAGIGNNIQQLVANFGELQKQAGSTGAALKATFASMLTPASLFTLGVAAVTSGLVLFEKWQQKAAKAAGEGGNALANAKKATEEYITSLDSLTRARLTGEREAQKEVTTLKLLYKQTQNTTLSLHDRKEAVEEIQRLYPAYFEGFTKEEILAGKASGAYDRLSQSILATARARAAQDIIADNARKQLENEQKLIDLQTELGKKKAKLDKAATISGSAASRASESNAIRQAINVSKAQGAVEDTQAEINTLVAENNKLKADSLRLEQQINTEIAKGAVLSGDVGGDKGKTKKVKEETDYLANLQKEYNELTKQAQVYGISVENVSAKTGALTTAINGLISQGISPQSATIQQLAGHLNGLNNIDLSGMQNTFEMFAASGIASLDKLLGKVQQVPIVMSAGMKSFFESQAAQAQEAVNFAASMANTLRDAIGNVFVDLGETLGSVFSGITSGASAIEAFGRGILASLGDLAVSFGKQLVALGVGKMALDSMFAFPGGGALAVAAGAALISAGSALSKSMQKKTGSLGGGGGGSLAPTISGTGGYKPATGTSFDRGPETLTAVVKGEDLLFTINRAQYRLGRIGG